MVDCTEAAELFRRRAAAEILRLDWTWELAP